MAGITVKFEKGRITHTAEAAIVGGQVVHPGVGPRSAVPATADSEKVLGVALTDAAPKVDPAPGVLYVGTDQVAVASAPAVVPVKSDGSANPGDLVVAHTAGAVKKAPAEAKITQIVGRVIEKITGADNIVLVRLGG
ncbi:head scaffolding protein [Gordonia phage Sidious]|uniref:Scaffolding protein n=1 Tax=Gordonia phage Sidious TaxID=2591118 RepID=A0A515MI50_9CAUD|nr:head scaffolding protein [Gordonia phage Sidious]QDM56352.1 scaffolding protein [Gordonia phage Sidious]